MYIQKGEEQNNFDRVVYPVDIYVSFNFGFYLCAYVRACLCVCVFSFNFLKRAFYFTISTLD